MFDRRAFLKTALAAGGTLAATSRAVAQPPVRFPGFEQRRITTSGATTIWREHAADLRGRALPGNHFLPEELPDETLAALLPFVNA